jgi:hypothetical protein
VVKKIGVICFLGELGDQFRQGIFIEWGGLVVKLIALLTILATITVQDSFDLLEML